MKGLTERQSAILQYIDDYIHMKGFSPSFREIMQHFDLSSIATVHSHIHALKKKGLLDLDNKASRSIIPIKAQGGPSSHVPSELFIPLVGQIAKGHSIETFPQPSNIAVPSCMVPDGKSAYALRIKPKGFWGMLEGDIILIEAKPDCMPGELVLGQALHEGCVIGTYFPEGSYTRLQALDPQEADLHFRSGELSIHGQVLSLLRLYV